MPRNVLDIDVHDEKWKRFVESFKEYQDNTEKLNEVWKHFDVAVGKPRAAAEALDKAIGKARKSSDAMHKTWTSLGTSIDHSNKSLSRFERTIHGVERGLSRVARISLSIGKFALVAGGVGFAGGLFGMDVLANSALQRQKAARGLGMPIGQVSAFETYMQPFLANPKGFLGAVVNARQTPSQEWAFPALGIPLGQAQNENPMQLAFQVMQKIRSLDLQNKNSGALSEILRARGAGVFGIGLEGARLLANASPGQLRNSFSQAKTAARAMQVPDSLATQWAKLSVQLHAAGIAIETALTNRLVKLAPLIGQLSRKVVKLIDQFVNSKDVGKVIDALGSGLKSGMQYLESGKFQSDLKDVGSAAESAAKALRVIGGFAEHHKTALQYGAEGAVGLWAAGKLAKIWKFATTPIKLFSGAASDVAEAAAPAISAPFAALAGLATALLYSPSLANSDMPLKFNYYRNPKDWRKYNNPGNIDPVIHGMHEYRKFPTMAAGYRAMANTVRGYHENTLAQIVGTYEGHNAPHLAEHIAKIAQWMHVGRSQNLDLSNQSTMAGLVTGLAEFENPHRQNYRELYNTIRDAIRDGMQSVTIHAQTSAGSRFATSMYAAKH